MPASPSAIHPLAHAARLALLGWAIAAGAAQATQATQAADRPADGPVQTYQIAPGPLGRALAEVAATAGIALSFDPALTQGRQSPALSGSHTPREALQHLLAGSGLRLETMRNGTFTVVEQPAVVTPVRPTQPPSAGDYSLREVRVEARRLGVGCCRFR